MSNRKISAGLHEDDLRNSLMRNSTQLGKMPNTIEEGDNIDAMDNQTEALNKRDNPSTLCKSQSKLSSKKPNQDS
jgi:hypothetical protein